MCCQSFVCSLENGRHQTVQRSERSPGEAGQRRRIDVRIVQITVALFQRRDAVFTNVVFTYGK